MVCELSASVKCESSKRRKDLSAARLCHYLPQHTSQVMAEPGVSKGRSLGPVFVPAVAATYWGVRTINHRVLESPHQSGHHCQGVTQASLVTLSDVMTPGQVREYWSLPGPCWKCSFCWSELILVTSVVFMAQHIRGHCLTPAVASGLCTRDNARGWHVMIYISPNTVFFSLFTSSSVSNV